MPTMHDIAIAKLLSDFPNLETHRFMACTRAAICTEDSEFTNVRIIPDAYEIHPSVQEVFCFEVEYGHPVSTEKMAKYVDLWWAVTAHNWELGLIIVDKWGQITREVSVGDYALRKLMADHPPLPAHMIDPDWARVASNMPWL